jgi:hypothetical protein
MLYIRTKDERIIKLNFISTIITYNLIKPKHLRKIISLEIIIRIIKIIVIIKLAITANYLKRIVIGIIKIIILERVKCILKKITNA